MTDVASITRNIQQRTREDGILGLNRNGNLKQRVQDFKSLTAAERNEVASRLTEPNFRRWLKT